jgi:hypothetical protein
VKPLRIAWKHRVPIGGSDWVHHLDNERLVIAWRGHGVVTYGTDSDEIGAIFDRDGHLVRRIAEPTGGRERYPMGLVTTWPDEGLALGMMRDRYEVVSVELDGASRIVSFDVQPGTTQKLLAMPDGGLLVSIVTGSGEPGRVDGPSGLDKELRQRPFEDGIYTTSCIDAGQLRWRAPGRAACVADDLVILEERAGSEKAIVARRGTDANEVWRQPALDRFVLGAVPVPAWSDDRIYLYDRGEMRRAVWERGLVYAASTHVTCASSRTGARHWSTDLGGDVVSFFVHPAWVAWIVARGALPTLHVHGHDGTRICGEALLPVESPEAKWPPGSGWPCIVHGDEEHVLVVQRESVEGDSAHLTAIRLASGKIAWTTPLATYLPARPALRTQRLLNEVPIAFAEGVAYFRSGPQLLGLRGQPR